MTCVIAGVMLRVSYRKPTRALIYSQQYFVHSFCGSCLTSQLENPKREESDARKRSVIKPKTRSGESVTSTPLPHTRFPLRTHTHTHAHTSAGSLPPPPVLQPSLALATTPGPSSPQPAEGSQVLHYRTARTISCLNTRPHGSASRPP